MYLPDAHCLSSCFKCSLLIKTGVPSDVWFCHRNFCVQSGEVIKADNEYFIFDYAELLPLVKKLTDIVRLVTYALCYQKKISPWIFPGDNCLKLWFIQIGWNLFSYIFHYFILYFSQFHLIKACLNWYMVTKWQL
jgi:hypothetical protein